MSTQTIALGISVVAFLLAVPLSLSQSLENTGWSLLKVGAEMVAGDAPQGPPTLTLEPDGNRATGTGGCNGFNAGYALDGDRIEFTPVAATMMMCPEGMDTEQAFFSALEAARTWAVVDAHLELYDTDGELLARFEAAGN